MYLRQHRTRRRVRKRDSIFAKNRPNENRTRSTPTPPTQCAAPLQRTPLRSLPPPPSYVEYESVRAFLRRLPPATAAAAPPLPLAPLRAMFPVQLFVVTFWLVARCTRVQGAVLVGAARRLSARNPRGNAFRGDAGAPVAKPAPLAGGGARAQPNQNNNQNNCLNNNVWTWKEIW